MRALRRIIRCDSVLSIDKDTHRREGVLREDLVAKGGEHLRGIRALNFHKTG